MQFRDMNDEKNEQRVRANEIDFVTCSTWRLRCYTLPHLFSLRAKNSYVRNTKPVKLGGLERLETHPPDVPVP